MKKYLVFLFASTVLKAFSQPVVVDGYVNNAQGNSVRLSIDRDYLGVNPEVVTGKTSEGNFSFALNEPKEFIAALNFGTESSSLFLAPGDTLHVAFTADLMSITMQMSGNAAGENLFLGKFRKKFSETFTDSLINAKMLTTGVDAFEIDLYNNRKKQMEFFKSDSSFSTFSPAFKNYFTNLVNYRYWNLLLAYPIERANHNTTISTVEELPQTLLGGFEKVKVSNADALICDSYRSFLKYYIIYFTSKQNSFNKFTDFSLSMEKKNAFAQTVLFSAPYQYWLSKFILEDFERAQPSTVKRLYDALAFSDKQGIYAPVVMEKCGAYMQKKDEMKKAASGPAASDDKNKEDYRIENEKGKLVKLTDFKGKVVYVDFWASWCGPCRGEMPHSKELHKKFTSKQLKNIVFLYVSIDKDSAAWQKAVKELGMEGIQAWSNNSWNNSAGKVFGIPSIPRYMLINKEGKIVDDQAKRPSDPFIYSDILNLLQ